VPDDTNCIRNYVTQCPVQACNNDACQDHQCKTVSCKNQACNPLTRSILQKGKFGNKEVLERLLVKMQKDEKEKIIDS
jgi:hypothetical protein